MADHTTALLAHLQSLQVWQIPALTLMSLFLNMAIVPPMSSKSAPAPDIESHLKYLLSPLMDPII